MRQQTILQRVLSQEENKQGNFRLPCNTLPVAENRWFFGRQDTLDEIDRQLKASATGQSRLSSIALFGLGGIGKTQTALAYAYRKLGELDAVFWIPAEDRLSIQQGFSRAATDALHLSGAHPQTPRENMIRVLEWIQHTSGSHMIDDKVASIADRTCSSS